MSKETYEWLNTYTLQSRRVWHTDDELQAELDESTIYAGAIPVEDVRRRLFSWKAVEGTVSSTGIIMNEFGVQEFTITDPNRKAMLRPPGALGAHDVGAMLGLFKSGYQGHDYEKWLLDEVAAILDDELGIYSAGLLRDGAQAWVQITIPDTIETPEGVIFRPNLLAVTSFDGSLATTYKRTIGNTVCDNTMAAGLAEDGETFKVKHSKYSDVKLMQAREALALIHNVADDFAAEVAELCATTVTNKQWSDFLDGLAPVDDPKTGERKTGRGLTLAENKRAEMSTLWNNDNRVSPWKNTAWGVIQAVNTHAHHIQTVRGAERSERNMQLAVTGGFDKLDAETRDALALVLS
jgi:phage/plasmid-like protein (TIGR03299 family)